MKRTAFISGLVFILGLTLSAQDNANKLEGSWSGNMKTAAGELQLVIHFAMTEADTVKASMDSPDQGVKGIPCGRVTLDDDTLMVDIPMVRGVFAEVSPMTQSLRADGHSSDGNMIFL